MIKFDGSAIALIVRYKRDASHVPDLLDQHADCILADGSPVGFYGEGGAASGGRAYASSNKAGMNMKGMVCYYDEMTMIRPEYTDATIARRLGVVSTVLIVPVPAAQSTLFTAYWRTLKLKPGSFSLLGNNCSTHASDAFRYARVVPGGIPGLDTPNNLYKQIVKLGSAGLASHSGHVGFVRDPAGGFLLDIQPVLVGVPVP